MAGQCTLYGMAPKGGGDSCDTLVSDSARRLLLLLASYMSSKEDEADVPSRAQPSTTCASHCHA